MKPPINPYQTAWGRRPGLHKCFIFDGPVGIWQTLIAMRALALEAGNDDRFCRWIDIQTGLGASVAGLEGQRRRIERIRQWVHLVLNYQHDPEEYEFVKSPFLMQAEISQRGFSSGDCDDHVTLLAAALVCIGQLNDMVAIEIPTEGPGYSHVVNAAVLADGSEMLIDTSVKDGVLDYEIAKKMVVTVL